MADGVFIPNLDGQGQTQMFHGDKWAYFKINYV